MWLVFGIAAAAFAFINLAKPDKNREIFRWASLSLTALALCAFYADGTAPSAERRLGRAHGHHAHPKSGAVDLNRGIHRAQRRRPFQENDSR